MDWRLGRCENKLVGTDLMLVFCSDLEKGHLLRWSNSLTARGKYKITKYTETEKRRRKKKNTMQPFFYCYVSIQICISRRLFFQSFWQKTPTTMVVGGYVRTLGLITISCLSILKNKI